MHSTGSLNLYQQQYNFESHVPRQALHNTAESQTQKRHKETVILERRETLGGRNNVHCHGIVLMCQSAESLDV